MILFKKAKIKKLHTTKAFWVDKNFKALKASDVDDNYLVHILYHVATGGGWRSFLFRKERINKLFEEGYKRKILRPDILLNWHTTALCINGFCEDWPNMLVGWDGSYENHYPQFSWYEDVYSQIKD